MPASLAAALAQETIAKTTLSGTSRDNPTRTANGLLNPAAIDAGDSPSAKFMPGKRAKRPARPVLRFSTRVRLLLPLGSKKVIPTKTATGSRRNPTRAARQRAKTVRGDTKDVPRSAEPAPKTTTKPRTTVLPPSTHTQNTTLSCLLSATLNSRRGTAADDTLYPAFHHQLSSSED